MKTKEEQNLKDKNNKIKRQVSIITVFLWIFLVATMVTIITGNIKNTNALEKRNDLMIYDESNRLDESYNSLGTLYSVNDVDKECILLYDAQGGIGAPPSETRNVDEVFTISDVIPQKQGYLFLGWSLDKNADTLDSIYSPKSSFSMFGDTTLYAIWWELRTEGIKSVGALVKCVNGYHKQGYFNLTGSNRCTFGNVYYSDEKKLYLCNVTLNGEAYCQAYSTMKKSTHYLYPYASNMTKELIICYDENTNLWTLLNKYDYPVFYCMCDINNTEVYGAYKVRHEYYKRDKDNNLILEDTVTTDTFSDVLLGVKVGISDENENVDIELTKMLEHTINDKKYVYEYFENSGNIIIEYDKLQEITLKYIREEGKDKILVKAEKIWEDNNNEYGKRPENVVLQIKNKNEIVEEKVVNENNNWKYDFVLSKYDKDGNEIKYTVDEKETSKFYEKTIDGYRVINKYIGEEEKTENNNEIVKDENVDTSDINICMYAGIAIISIIIIIIVILLVKKNNRKNK